MFFLLIRCSYIVYLNDMFRPFHGPFSGWSLFSLQGKPYVDNNNIALLIVRFALQRKKVINLKMARGRAETCLWEKLCKNILVIKTLIKLVWLYFTKYFVIPWGIGLLEYTRVGCLRQPTLPLSIRINTGSLYRNVSILNYKRDKDNVS